VSPFASTKMARITGTWLMTGEIKQRRAHSSTNVFSSSAAIYKEVPPRFDKKEGILVPGSCRISAVRFILCSLVCFV
jgi:hypothetical protein